MFSWEKSHTLWNKPNGNKEIISKNSSKLWKYLIRFRIRFRWDWEKMAIRKLNLWNPAIYSKPRVEWNKKTEWVKFGRDSRKWKNPSKNTQKHPISQMRFFLFLPLTAFNLLPNWLQESDKMLLFKTNSLQFIRSISKLKLHVMSSKRPFLIWNGTKKSLKCICKLKTKNCLKICKPKFRNFQAQMLSWPPSRANLSKPQVKWLTGQSLSIKLRLIRLTRTQRESEWLNLLKDWERYCLSMELKEMK